MNIDKVDMRIEYPYSTLTFFVPFAQSEEVQEIRDCFTGSGMYDLTLKRRLRRRSMDSNSYYWLLVSKLAGAWTPPESRERMHNILLARYGTDWTDENNNLTYVMLPDNDRYLDMTDFHYRPSDITEERAGVRYRWYILLKPSHMYDQKEFNRLLDGLVSECRECGIRVEDWTERIRR